VPSDAPALAADGCCVKLRWSAAAALIVKLELVPVVRPAFVASSVYVPALFTAQPENVATPLTTVTGFVVHEKPSVPPALVIASVTWVELSFATILPPLSSTATTGCVANATPAVAGEGDVVKASFDAAPKMSIAAAGLAAAASRVVLTVNPDAAYVPAAGFVTPAMVSEPAALAASAHVPALSLMSIVTVVPEPVAVAEQFAKPLGSVMVGDAVIVKPAGKTTVIVSAASSAPLGLAVKPTVQVAAAAAARVEAANVTDEGDVAAFTVSFAAGFDTTVSVDVFTLNVVLRSEPAPGFVKPESFRAAAVVEASAHDAPERVTVTVCAAAAADAVQLLKPLVSVTPGVAGTVKPELKTMVSVSPAASAPDA
jgi:hypothetical protein